MGRWSLEGARFSQTDAAHVRAVRQAAEAIEVSFDYAGSTFSGRAAVRQRMFSRFGERFDLAGLGPLFGHRTQS